MKLAFVHCARMKRRIRRTRSLLAAVELKQFEPCLDFSGALYDDADVVCSLCRNHRGTNILQHCI